MPVPQEMQSIPAGVEPKVIALSTKTESSYTFDALARHEAFRDYKGAIIAADFVVIPGEGVRKEPIVAGDALVGFKFTGVVDGQERTIINIDHHDSDQRMQRVVSSANLAVAYMNAFEQTQEYPVNIAQTPVRIAVSHYDCDSISAAAILSGAVDRQYWPFLEDAVIAADHTGAENLIADVLQGLDEMMSIAQVRRERGLPAEGVIDRKNFVYSFQALRAMLAGKPESELPLAAQEALHQRRASRERARAVIAETLPVGIIRDPESGEILREVRNLGNGVYFLRLGRGQGGKIPTELLPGLLPDAVAIVEASPHRRDASRWEVAIRSGMQFPDGGNFHNLGISDSEGPYRIGGRWNAGSSGRGHDKVTGAPGNSDQEVLAIAQRFSSPRIRQELIGQK